MVKLSIVMVAENEEYFNHSLNSIFNQNYSDYELIIYVQEELDLLNQIDRENVRIIRIGEMSSSKIRRRALDEAKGEYIYYFDAKDFFLWEGALSDRMSEIQQLNADFYADVPLEFKNGEYYFLPSSNDTLVRVTNHNFLLLARLRLAFQVFIAKYIRVDLLKKLTDEQWENKDIELLYEIIKLSKSAYYISNSSFAFRRDEDRIVEGTVFSEKYLVSDCSRFIESNRTLTTHKSNEMHIAICIEKFIFEKIGPLLYSIGKNNDIPTFVYLIYYDVEKESIEHYLKLNDYFSDLTIQLVQIPNYLHAVLEEIPLDVVFLPLASYYRILIPELFPELDRMLYIDTDTIVNQSLMSLWNTDLEGNYLGAIRDLGNVGLDGGWGSQLLGKNFDKYINSGVLLMDLKLIRERNLSLKFINFCKVSSNLCLLGDQDAYNLFFFNAIKYLDIRNNYVVTLFGTHPRNVDEITILHYLGPNKPWEIENPGDGLRKQAYEAYQNYYDGYHALNIESKL